MAWKPCTAWERYIPEEPGPVAPRAGLPWQLAQSTGLLAKSWVPWAASCFFSTSFSASFPWHLEQLISSDVGTVVVVFATTLPLASFTVISPTW